MKTTIISFYADIEGTDQYARFAEQFAADCRAHGLPHDVRQIASRGTYRLNCLAKPSYIRDRLREHQAPILWVDVDSRICRDMPEVDALSCDVGFARRTDAVSTIEVLASPIYVANTPAGHAFLDQWCADAEAWAKSDKPGFDHERLLELLESDRHGARVGYLGPEYGALPWYDVDNVAIYFWMSDSESKRQELARLGLPPESIVLSSLGNITFDSETVGIARRIYRLMNDARVGLPTQRVLVRAAAAFATALASDNELERREAVNAIERTLSDGEAELAAQAAQPADVVGGLRRSGQQG